MEIHIPNSAFLGNIDPFLKGFNPRSPDKLTITSNKKWISVHPMVLSMIAALGIKTKSSQISCDNLEAKSKHYLEIMGLFKFLGIKSGIKVKKHEPAGRFVPLTQIKDAKNLTSFINDLTPLLHLSPDQADPIRYIMSELIRNVLEQHPTEQSSAPNTTKKATPSG